jgi:hypothetical protein
LDTRSVYLGIGLSILFSRHIPPLKWPIYKLNGNVIKFESKLSKIQITKKSVTNRNYILNNFISYLEHSDLLNLVLTLVLTFWTKVEFKSKSLSEFEPLASLNKFLCSVSDTKDTAFQLPCKNAAYNFSDQKGRPDLFSMRK